VTQPEAQPELMTPQEVADYLRIPLRTVYLWRSKGIGPPGKTIGRHLRYRRSALEAWIDEQP
jgi:excisionase family DNA binding protein